MQISILNLLYHEHCRNIYNFILKSKVRYYSPEKKKCIKKFVKYEKNIKKGFLNKYSTSMGSKLEKVYGSFSIDLKSVYYFVLN